MHASGGAHVSVPTVSLDWLLQEHAQPELGARVLVKLDVEGAEAYALPPAIASGALCRSVDLLALELHAPGGRNQAPRSAEMSAAMARLRQLLDGVREAWRAGTCRTRVLEVSQKEDLPWGWWQNETASAARRDR